MIVGFLFRYNCFDMSEVEIAESMAEIAESMAEIAEKVAEIAEKNWQSLLIWKRLPNSAISNSAMCVAFS